MTASAVLALAVGLVCGAVFAAFKLPAPAPSALPGILGIIGIYAGYVVIGALR